MDPGLSGPRAAFYKCQAPRILMLKVGAPVILLKNLSAELVNGLQGVVHEVSENPVVNFNGKLVTLERYKFIYEKGIRHQYPIKLSFALTVHKAQGQTLQHVIVDCRDFFAAGQLGVAVGRARSLAGLQVINYSSEIGKTTHSNVLLDFLSKCSTNSDSNLCSQNMCCRLKLFPEQTPQQPETYIL